MTTKTFARRDSATALLRKLGVAKENYAHYIRGDKDTGFTVGLITVNGKLAVADLPKTKKVVKDGGKAARVAKVKKPTVSSVAREAILKGKANDAVFALLKEQFGLDESKKHYPAWYRSELRRQGKLPAAH